MKKLMEECSNDHVALCKKIPFMDQSIVNDNKNKIKYEMIPMRWQIHGTLFLPENKKSLLFHHAVDTKTLNDKIMQMEKVRSWVMG
jgi:predicted metalloprotease with PDZ domain